MTCHSVVELRVGDQKCPIIQQQGPVRAQLEFLADASCGTEQFERIWIETMEDEEDLSWIGAPGGRNVIENPFHYLAFKGAEKKDNKRRDGYRKIRRVRAEDLNVWASARLLIPSFYVRRGDATEIRSELNTDDSFESVLRSQQKYSAFA